jgi:hypothetical protein
VAHLHQELEAAQQENGGWYSSYCNEMNWNLLSLVLYTQTAVLTHSRLFADIHH